jgi:6-phosphogluconolactonase
MNAPAPTSLFPKRAFVGILVVCLVALFSSRPLTPQSPPQFVYTADESTHMISAFVLNPSTGALTPVADSPFNERLDPFALAVDPAGKFLFVANNSTSDVSFFAINQTSGALTEAPNSPYAGGMGFNPTVLTTDVSGKFLFVGNTHFHDVGGSSGEVDVYSIDPVTGVLTPSARSLTTDPAFGPSPPVGIFAHPSGKWLYLMGGPQLLNELVVLQQYSIDPTTGELGSGVTYTSSELARSLAATPTGAFIYCYRSSRAIPTASL